MADSSHPMHESTRPSDPPSHPQWRVWLDRLLVNLEEHILFHGWRGLALALILAMVLGAAAIVLFPPAIGQGGTGNWWPIVQRVAHGEGYVSCQSNYFPFCANADQRTASREPVPVLAFAWLAQLSNDSLYAAAGLELTIFLAITLGIFALARQLLSTAGAVVAVLLWALYLPAYRLIPQVSGDLLATLGMIWGIYFIVRARKTEHLSNWLAAGACLGFGALSRSVLIYIAVALALWLAPWQAWRKHTWQWPRASTALLISFFAILSPWMVRNVVIFGEPISGSTLSGYNLYRHNAHLDEPNFLRFAGPEDGQRAVAELLATRTDLRGNENEAEMNAIYTDAALTIIAEHPLRYLALSGYRFFALWFDSGVDAAYNDDPDLITRVIVIQQVVLLGLAFVGVLRLGQRSDIIIIPTLVLTAMHMAVVARLRFTIVVMPLIFVAAAICIVHMIQWLKLQPRRSTS